MKNLRMAVVLMLALVLSACAGTTQSGGLLVAATVPPTQQPATQDNSSAEQTGLVLKGTVALEGSPLEGVRIYRTFASYEGEMVAVTGKDGTYRSEFTVIPGDEMVTV